METLGPYAKAFGGIITGAAIRRTDIDDMKKLLEVTGTKLYRGTGLTKKELKNYRKKIAKKKYWLFGEKVINLVTLTGFTSTTMIRSIAQKFTWSNED